MEELLTSPPESEKATLLQDKQAVLAAVTNTMSVTHEWTPHETRDVGGPRPLSCLTFLDYTSENPAPLPDVTQLMWVHLEEPDPDADVHNSKRSRLWYRVSARD